MGSVQFELPKNYMGDILTFDMYAAAAAAAATVSEEIWDGGSV